MSTFLVSLDHPIVAVLSRMARRSRPPRCGRALGPQWSIFPSIPAFPAPRGSSVAGPPALRARLSAPARGRSGRRSRRPPPQQPPAPRPTPRVPSAPPPVAARRSRSAHTAALRRFAHPPLTSAWRDRCAADRPGASPLPDVLPPTAGPAPAAALAARSPTPSRCRPPPAPAWGRPARAAGSAARPSRTPPRASAGSPAAPAVPAAPAQTPAVSPAPHRRPEPDPPRQRRAVFLDQPVPLPDQPTRLHIALRRLPALPLVHRIPMIPEPRPASRHVLRQPRLARRPGRICRRLRPHDLAVRHQAAPHREALRQPLRPVIQRGVLRSLPSQHSRQLRRVRKILAGVVQHYPVSAPRQPDIRRVPVHQRRRQHMRPVDCDALHPVHCRRVAVLEMPVVPDVERHLPAVPACPWSGPVQPHRQPPASACRSRSSANRIKSAPVRPGRRQHHSAFLRSTPPLRLPARHQRCPCLRQRRRRVHHPGIGIALQRRRRVARRQLPRSKA